MGLGTFERAMLEAEEFQAMLKTLRKDIRWGKRYEKDRRRELKKEERKYALPAGVPLFEIDLELMERAEKQRERRDFYWSKREYLYKSGLPYDLVDLFNIGEIDSK